MFRGSPDGVSMEFQLEASGTATRQNPVCLALREARDCSPAISARHPQRNGSSVPVAQASSQFGFSAEYVAESRLIRGAARRFLKCLFILISLMLGALALNEIYANSTPAVSATGKTADRKGFGDLLQRFTQLAANN